MFSWKLYFKTYFIDICPQGFSQEYASIGSDNALALNRRQAFLYTNVGIGLLMQGWY